MLHDLNWLKEGEVFPPYSERERMERYTTNRKLFETKHGEVYDKQLKRIERVIGNFDEVISYPIIVNFQKIMSLKIADLLLGEPPTLSTVDDNGSLGKIQERNDIVSCAYQVGIDVSRYGDGLFFVHKENGHGVIDVTQPGIWFPIVDPDNIHNVTCHVLAWTVGDKIKAQLHYKGSYIKREYEYISSMTGKLIGKLLSSEEKNTGLDDFAVVQVPNVLTSDRCTGIDDYMDIDTIVSDLMVRIGQIDRILDKHANPSMQGPETALEKDPLTGEYRLKVGSYFARDPGDAEVSYITWNGQLDANFKQVERLLNLLYSISEMGSAIFGDMTTMTGQVPSGSALRRLMISPLAKVNRIRMRFDPALKKAIRLCSQLGGDGIKPLKDVSIVWQDGLPGDALEEANIMMLRTGNKPTMSQLRALKTYDMMNPQDAEDELSQITDEEVAISPMIAPV